MKIKILMILVSGVVIVGTGIVLTKVFDSSPEKTPVPTPIITNTSPDIQINNEVLQKDDVVATSSRATTTPASSKTPSVGTKAPVAQVPNDAWIKLDIEKPETAISIATTSPWLLGLNSLSIVVSSGGTVSTPSYVPPTEDEEEPEDIDNVAIERYDYDEIDLANRDGQWLYAENSDNISLNFVEKYNVNTVTVPTNYTITSTDDEAYAGGQNPTSVSYRWRTIYAPTIRKVDLKVAYRAFLKLPTDLKNGKTYTVTASNLGITTEPFTFTYSDETLNQNIKVNQVGYLPTKDKIAYVGQYAGTGGPMEFNVPSFELKKSDGTTVFTGTPTFRNIDTQHTGENVYELNFSSFQTPGEYYLYVPGVGKSYTFRIAVDVYNEVLGNAMKGAYHERSGTQLTSEFTRFTHGLAHINDAFVMEHNPIPQWFRDRFDSQGDTSQRDGDGARLYYPTTLSGQKIEANKGHYDAGDYGKYVVNGSLFASNILAGFEAFPQRLMKDDSQIPERANGIPDLLDEVKWELDWLENMQDPNDGGVFCIVKPDGAVEFYENRLMDTVSPSNRLLYPKDTTCTGAYAATLAKAARSPLIQQFYPTEAARYLVKAKKAFEFLENNAGYLGWHHYGLKDEFDTDRSMDERVWASIELYNATGEDAYKDFFMAHANPEYVRWGWNTLFEASGQANYACAFSTQALDAAMKTRCANEITRAADSHVTDSSNRAYRLSMSDSPLNFRQYTYFFPQERIIQLLIANAITPKPEYEQVALHNWDYILGANPTSYSYITGIGSKRFREQVFTQGVYDDIKAPVSGIPIGMGNNFGYLDTYGSSLAQMFPLNDGGSPVASSSYPLLKQVYDGWNIGVEFTVPEIAENLISAAYFATDPIGTNTFPTNVNIEVEKTTGAVPFTVHFKGSATDADGKIVRYFWDFDDETYSIQQNPVHTFTDAYKTHKVVLTVTDNEGAESYKEILIRTSPPVFNSSSVPYDVDANTLALFHFDSSPIIDATGKGYTIVASGTAALSDDNVLWMADSAGKSIAFNSVNDTASVEIPRVDIFPTATSTLVFEAKLFVDSYLSENVKTSAIFALEQGDSRKFGFYDAIYIDGTHVNVMNGYGGSEQEKFLTRTQIATLMSQGKMQKGTWFNLKLVIGNGKVRVYVDNDMVAESNIIPNFAASNQAVTLKIGGFKGYMDELRISNIIR